MEKMETDNLEIFNYLRSKYTNLNNVRCENNTLIFNDGKVSLDGILLSSFPENIFSMQERNLYFYLSNKFYIHEEEKYKSYVFQVLELIKSPLLNEANTNIIQKFTMEYILKNELYLNEACLANDIEYRKELNELTKIINFAYSYESPGCELIRSINNDYLNSKNKNNTNEAGPEQNNNKSRNKGKTLSLLKGGIKYYENDENDNLDMAGFVNILLIIFVIIGVGILVASKLID